MTLPLRSVARVSKTVCLLVLAFQVLAISVVESRQLVRDAGIPSSLKDHGSSNSSRGLESISNASRSNVASVHDCAVAGKLPTSHLIETISDQSFPSRLGRCAVVGSGSGLLSRGAGDTIDQHDTVIRVNRIPNDKFFADVGRRTDIYFVNLDKDYQLRPNTTSVRELGSVRGFRLCNLQTGIGCPFKAILFEGNPNGGYERQEHTAIPVGYQVDDLHYLEHRFLPVYNSEKSFAEGRHLPTGGLKVLLTFAPLCDSISLYGFSGSAANGKATAIDGHIAPTSHHDFKAEHEFLDHIIGGEIGKLQFPPVHAELDAHVIHHLACMATSQRITRY